MLELLCILLKLESWHGYTKLHCRIMHFPSSELEADITQEGHKEVSNFFPVMNILKDSSLVLWTSPALPLSAAHPIAPHASHLSLGYGDGSWACVCFWFVPVSATSCAILIQLAFSLVRVLLQGRPLPGCSISATKTDCPEPSFFRDQLHLYCSSGSLSIPSVIFQNKSCLGSPPNTNVSNNQGSQRIPSYDYRSTKWKAQFIPGWGLTFTFGTMGKRKFWNH